MHFTIWMFSGGSLLLHATILYITTRHPVSLWKKLLVFFTVPITDETGINYSASSSSSFKMGVSYDWLGT